MQLCSNLKILWHCLSLGLMKTELFQSCGHCWVFQICWHIECSNLKASSFRIWNTSTRVPSPLLPLFIVMLPNGLFAFAFQDVWLLSVITPPLLSGSWRSFLYSSSVYSCHLFLISSASVTSNRLILWYVNYISIKLWEKKAKVCLVLNVELFATTLLQYKLQILPQDLAKPMKNKQTVWKISLVCLFICSVFLEI